MKNDKNKLKQLREDSIDEIEEVEVVDAEAEDELNERQLLFVDYYMTSNFNAREAATKAGYSERSAGLQGHRLMQNPYIKTLINQKKLQLKLENGITKNDILEDLLILKQKAMDGEIPSRDGLKAIDLINKMLGMYEADKLSIESKSVQVNYIEPNDNSIDNE